MKKYWVEDREEALKEASEKHLMLVRGYDAVVDMDYYGVCTKEEYLSAKEYTRASSYSWVVDVENFEN